MTSIFLLSFPVEAGDRNVPEWNATSLNLLGFCAPKSWPLGWVELEEVAESPEKQGDTVRVLPLEEEVS